MRCVEVFERPGFWNHWSKSPIEIGPGKKAGLTLRCCIGATRKCAASAGAKLFPSRHRNWSVLRVVIASQRVGEDPEGTGLQIVGQSPALTRVLHQVEMVAGSRATVLIQGESGTGKELIAHAIHQRSPRANKPLIRVNCGSIPNELFESEFFGHVRGSFTGAIRDRAGRFQMADHGTLFLDEVGEIPLELQAKLLRVLQEGEFERVGDDATKRVDVRVVAATNRDLNQESAAGRFRLDLFYRLAVFPVEVPPLRDRLEDIPLLASHFIHKACARFNLVQPRVTQNELESLRTYTWPGNVRELQNVVERAVIVAGGGPLTFCIPLNQVPPTIRLPHAGGILTDREFRLMERANLVAALTMTAGRVSGAGGAAELLGVKPSTLASRVKSLKILDEEWRDQTYPDD